jgi:hypothetical protein
VGSVTVDVTIQYSYDPLYRLTGADYSDGDSYYSVGNRLEQETRVKGLISTTEYTYDHANQLKSVSNQTIASSYQYDGVENRLQQTADEVTNTYVNDLISEPHGSEMPGGGWRPPRASRADTGA